MIRKSILVGLLCVLGTASARAQAPPEALIDSLDVYLVFPGPFYTIPLDSLFRDARRLVITASSSNDSKIIHSFGLRDTLVIALTTSAETGDTARITVTARNTLGADSTVIIVTVSRRISRFSNSG